MRTNLVILQEIANFFLKKNKKKWQKKFLVLFVHFYFCEVVHAQKLSRVIVTRAISSPAGGRSIFGAYNDFARDIQRMQTPRVKIFLWLKMVLCVGPAKGPAVGRTKINFCDLIYSI
jgi:hypothetical protein